MDSNQQNTGLHGMVGNNIHYSGTREIKDDESIYSHGKEDLKTFAQDTTLHGAKFMFTKNIFRRLLWSLVLIASITYCIYQVVISMNAFYHRPFITKISIATRKEGKELLFPAVSLCNINAFNTRRYRSAFKGSSDGLLIERKIKDISLLTTKADAIYKEEFIKRNPELFHRQNAAEGTLDMQGKLSHQIGEMLLPSISQFHSCSINGIPCTANNFTSHMSSAYGQCYTFNSADSEQPLLNVTLAGQNSGLKLRLNIERDSYIAARLRPLVGLTIIVHDQKSFPFMEEFGLAIQPGISTLCAIKRKKVRKAILLFEYKPLIPFSSQTKRGSGWIGDGLAFSFWLLAFGF